MTSGSAAMAARMRSTSCPSTGNRLCSTPSSSTQAAAGSPAAITGSNSAESPDASDRPHTGSRLARTARSRSSRSLLAFGSVRSWGRTAPTLGGESSSAPTTPLMRRGAPDSSVKAIR